MIKIDNKNFELLTILGPTASGKTKLAVELALKTKGEIISADSRQIYRGMDIGTGKDIDEYSTPQQQIDYHLIDILDPIDNYSVYEFKNDFFAIYNKIIKKKNTPILCGGTGLYIESVLLNYKMFNVKPNIELREKLDRLSKQELLDYFRRVSPDFYKNWKKDTKQRIIRGIEISISDNHNIVSNNEMDITNNYTFGVLIERKLLRSKIKLRLENRLHAGMIDEVKNMLKNGLSFERLNYFGLEYKYVGLHLNNKLSLDELNHKLYIEISRFAKKQMTFFRRMEKRGIVINWMQRDEILNKISQIN